MARGDTAAALADLQVAFAEALAIDHRALLAGVGSGLAALPAGLGEPAAAAVVLGAAHAVRGATDALHPDVARLTHDLRRALRDRFTGCYDRGRSLGRAAAAALLASELAAAQANVESLTGRESQAHVTAHRRAR